MSYGEIMAVTLYNSTCGSVLANGQVFEPYQSLQIVSIPAGSYVLKVAGSRYTTQGAYWFYLAYAGPSQVPEIDVKGNGITIPDGDMAPYLSDNTFFQYYMSFSHAFTIQNTGNSELNLTGSPHVEIVGSDASHFFVKQQPESPIPVGGSTTFEVEFRPTSSGLKEAMISIANDDSNEDPYNFAIAGEALGPVDLPEIVLRGSGEDIDDGDNTPALSDGTYFGAATVASESIIRTFMISNVGDARLYLPGSPPVTISGPHASDFSIAEQPSTSVAAGGETRFSVSFVPTAEGTREAVVSIENDDSDENPYDFLIRGTGEIRRDPEMVVIGNGIEIVAGDQTPSPEDNTDLGDASVGGEPLERSFTITNAGPGVLNLDGSPTVAIGGPAAGDFSVIQWPETSVPAGDSTGFSLRFAPSVGGVRAATLTIASNDADEDPYVFAIQGIGSTVPEIALSGNGQAIADGDTTPSADDHTDFGAVDVAADGVVRAFSIHNEGTGPLTLTADPPVLLTGPAAADFEIVVQPTTPVPPGGSAEVRVGFRPTILGSREATLLIANDDANEDPYDIVIAGTGISAPEIAVTGAGIDIATGDGSPDASDGTDFGSADIAADPVVHAFVIENLGSATLWLTGSPAVRIDGAGAFTVVGAPQTELPPGGSTSFEVHFDPNTAGLHQAVVEITNNDPDEAPFSFAIRGTGIATPDIGLAGNGKPVADGDRTPDPADGTEFGPADIDTGQVTHAFTIHNSGIGALRLTGTPPVQLTGGQAGDFSIPVQPQTPIAPGASASFQVRFDPEDVGLRQVHLHIASDDPDESPYVILLQGTGTAEPEIGLLGNGQPIADGDGQPDAEDHTDFGGWPANGGGLVRTFTLTNMGSSDLHLTATPPVSLKGAEAGDFRVVAHPSTPIPPGGSSAFQVRFVPAALGLRRATVSIPNDDADERVYDFAVQGVGEEGREVLAERAVAIGNLHSCAISAAGGAMCWGANSVGQLGDGSLSDRSTPVAVSGLGSGVVALTAGAGHTCALTDRGAVKCWGRNASGQLGDGTHTDRATPVTVTGLESGVQYVAAGGEHACAVTAGGGLKCWGANADGQLGDGGSAESTIPVDAVGLTGGVARVTAGAYHSCALLDAGVLKCWGKNGDGQLGDGTTVGHGVATNVTGLGAGVVAVDAGRSHTCAIVEGGALGCWGDNAYGQVGDGSQYNDRKAPVQVNGLTAGTSATASGGYHSCALSDSGAVKCWGYNEDGQLGIGSILSRSTPVNVSGLTDAVAVAAGLYHSCALTEDGLLRCWGKNANGQIGDGTTTRRTTPVAVTGAWWTGGGGADIAGTVTGPSGEALENVRVRAYAWTGVDWGYAREAVPEADGDFRIGGLAAGTYRVCFDVDRADGYASQCFDNAPNLGLARDVAVSEGNPVEGIVARLAPAAEISGTVRDLLGRPIPNIGVQAYAWQGSDWLYAGWGDTDTDGRYRIGGLPGHTYRLCFGDYLIGEFAYQCFDHASDPDTANDLSLGEGERRTVDIHLLGAGDSGDVCEEGPILIDTAGFAPGMHRLSSRHSIVAQGNVLVQSGAELSLHAPRLAFGPGLRIAVGAKLRAGAGAVSCAPAEEGQQESTLPGKAMAATDLIVEPAFAPLRLSSTSELAPDWHDALDRYGVDTSLIEGLIVDANGPWLLFETAQDILPADANGTSDIYRLDTFLETLTLVSRTPAGSAGNGPSRYPAADATGELVVFQSAADDLVEGDENGVSDIFLHDAPVAETSRITLLDAGAAARPALDAAGQDLLYDQRGEDGRRQVLLEGLWDGLPAETLSLPEDATGAALDNHHPAISADGRHVAYLEAAERVDEIDAGSAPGCHIYFYDRDTGWFERTPCPDAVAADPEAARPAFSADGAQVEWFLPGADNPAVVPNPLVGAATGAEK
jgi:alpha-tubulin suppressor-like RCC1 family protein